MNAIFWIIIAFVTAIIFMPYLIVLCCIIGTIAASAEFIYHYFNRKI